MNLKKVTRLFKSKKNGGKSKKGLKPHPGDEIVGNHSLDESTYSNNHKHKKDKKNGINNKKPKKT